SALAGDRCVPARANDSGTGIAFLRLDRAPVLERECHVEALIPIEDMHGTLACLVAQTGRNQKRSQRIEHRLSIRVGELRAASAQVQAADLLHIAILVDDRALHWIFFEVALRAESRRR